MSGLQHQWARNFRSHGFAKAVSQWSENVAWPGILTAGLDSSREHYGTMLDRCGIDWRGKTVYG